MPELSAAAALETNDVREDNPARSHSRTVVVGAIAAIAALTVLVLWLRNAPGWNVVAW